MFFLLIHEGEYSNIISNPKSLRIEIYNQEQRLEDKLTKEKQHTEQKLKVIIK